MDFNLDYKLIDTDIIFNNEQYNASLWVLFKEKEMISKFILKKENKVILEKDIDKADNGNEFFLMMYKTIGVKGKFIIIKGHYSVSYLPLKIEIP